MWGRTLCVVAALGLAAGCAGRRTEDRVSQGVQGASSPAESGQHGPETATRPGSADGSLYQTAGLTGEITNGKVDVTMEGSGNLAWQGNYERAKRAKAAQQPAAPAQQTAPKAAGKPMTPPPPPPPQEK